MQDGRRQFLRTLGGGTALAAAGGLAGCSILGGGVPQTNTIRITEEGFDPKNARASSDQDVVFENRSGETITLQSENSDALNQEIDADAAYPASLSQGTYVITTQEHSDWQMKLAVGEELEDPL